MPHALSSPGPGSRADGKIDMMGTSLGYMDAATAELYTLLPGIQDDRVRAQIGQLAETARCVAAYLRTTLENATSTGDCAESAVALARVLEDIRAALRQLIEQEDATDEIAGTTGDGRVSDLVHDVQDASGAFWHLLVLFLRKWALKGAIDMKFDD